MGQTAHDLPPVAAITEAKRLLDLAEAAESCAREWRARAQTLLPNSQSILTRAMEQLVEGARGAAGQGVIGRIGRAPIPQPPMTGRRSEINAMIRHTWESPDGLTAREMAFEAGWKRPPYPSDLNALATRRGMKIAVLAPREGSTETRFRFYT